MRMVLFECGQHLIERLAIEVAHAHTELAREQLYEIVLEPGIASLRIDIARGPGVAREHYQLARAGHGQHGALRDHARVADHRKHYQERIDPVHAFRAQRSRSFGDL